MEWKHVRSAATGTTCADLETFLGGMETEEVSDNLQRQRRPLETFLGGMETYHSLVVMALLGKP